jgi:hypothetical protein
MLKLLKRTMTDKRAIDLLKKHNVKIVLKKAKRSSNAHEWNLMRIHVLRELNRTFIVGPGEFNGRGYC